MKISIYCCGSRPSLQENSVAWSSLQDDRVAHLIYLTDDQIIGNTEDCMLRSFTSTVYEYRYFSNNKS